MKKILLIVIAFCSMQTIFAQRHELGVFLGGANVIGDVGKGNYINPFPTKLESNGSQFFPISLGALYRFNFNPYMGLRANFSFSKVGASDHLSGEQYKRDRNASFKNEIVEGSVLFEYNFTDINEAQKLAHAPYLFFGVGLANFKSRYYDINEEQTILYTKSERENKVVLPFGVGYKVKFNYNWVVSLETGFRYTGHDNLDYNNPRFTNELLQAGKDDPKIQEIIDSKIYGDIKNKDWYVLTGLTLTYTFGRPACYCN
jgi:opacity protein-like surface antigen